MKTPVFLLALLTIQVPCFSQVALGYFPFQSLLCLSSNTEKLLFVDYKLETNHSASNFNMELSPKIHFKRSEPVNYYLGAGLSFNPAYVYADLPLTNGYFLDLGLRAKPFNNYRALQIVFEISPYVNREFSSGNLRTRLGVAWNFKPKSKPQGS